MHRTAAENPENPVGSAKIAFLDSDIRFEVDSSAVSDKEDWMMMRFHAALKNRRIIGRTHIIHRLSAASEFDHCDADVHRPRVLKQ